MVGFRYERRPDRQSGSGRGVAQPGRALASGARGRKFKSCHPDQSSRRPLLTRCIALRHSSVDCRVLSVVSAIVLLQLAPIS